MSTREGAARASRATIGIVFLLVLASAPQSTHSKEKDDSKATIRVEVEIPRAALDDVRKLVVARDGRLVSDSPSRPCTARLAIDAVRLAEARVADLHGPGLIDFRRVAADSSGVILTVRSASDVALEALFTMLKGDGLLEVRRADLRRRTRGEVEEGVTEYVIGLLWLEDRLGHYEREELKPKPSLEFVKGKMERAERLSRVDHTTSRFEDDPESTDEGEVSRTVYQLSYPRMERGTLSALLFNLERGIPGCVVTKAGFSARAAKTSESRPMIEDVDIHLTVTSIREK